MAGAPLDTSVSPPGAASASPRSRAVPLAVSALLLALVAVVYAQARAFAFVNLDDPQYVTANPAVLRGLHAEGLAWAFGTFHAANWHPLTWLSHMADVSLFGLDAGAHHLVSAALHALNAVLLFAFLRRATGATWRSAAVAALFAIHPLHVESVAWVSERKDVLSGLLFFLTLHAWLGWVRRGGAARYLAAAGLFALGLLAKPMLVTLPFVLLLLDFWPLGRLRAGGGGRRGPVLAALVVEKLPLLALALASSVATWLAQESGDAVVALEAIPLGGRVSNALVSYVLYVSRTVWPSGLAAFYPHPALAEGGIPAWETLGAAALLCGLTAAAVRQRSRRPWLLFGWLWFAGMLVPVAGLVQVGAQGLADRYTYLPLVGLLVAAAWGAAEVVERLRLPRWAVAGAFGVVLVALGAAAHRQAETWQDSLSLHRRALAVTERNWNAWNGLGDALSDAGRPAEAIPAYREALRLDPRLASAWNGLGAAQGRLGAPGEAIAPLQEALRLRPRYADAWQNLGTAWAALGQHARAAECFRSAVRLRPDDARGWTSLGIASLLAGDRRGLEESLEALRTIDPARERELRAAADAAARP